MSWDVTDGALPDDIVVAAAELLVLLESDLAFARGADSRSNWIDERVPGAGGAGGGTGAPAPAAAGDGAQLGAGAGCPGDSGSSSGTDEVDSDDGRAARGRQRADAAVRRREKWAALLAEAVASRAGLSESPHVLAGRLRWSDLAWHWERSVRPDVRLLVEATTAGLLTTARILERARARVDAACAAVVDGNAAGGDAAQPTIVKRSVRRRREARARRLHATRPSELAAAAADAALLRLAAICSVVDGLRGDIGVIVKDTTLVCGCVCCVCACVFVCGFVSVCVRALTCVRIDLTVGAAGLCTQRCRTCSGASAFGCVAGAGWTVWRLSRVPAERG